MTVRINGRTEALRRAPRSSTVRPGSTWHPGVSEYSHTHHTLPACAYKDDGTGPGIYCTPENVRDNVSRQVSYGTRIQEQNGPRVMSKHVTERWPNVAPIDDYDPMVAEDVKNALLLECEGVPRPAPVDVYSWDDFDHYEIMAIARYNEEKGYTYVD